MIVSILSGSPGTGKSMFIREIAQNPKYLNPNNLPNLKGILIELRGATDLVFEEVTKDTYAAVCSWLSGFDKHFKRVFISTQDIEVAHRLMSILQREMDEVYHIFPSV